MERADDVSERATLAISTTLRMDENKKLALKMNDLRSKNERASFFVFPRNDDEISAKQRRNTDLERCVDVQIRFDPRRSGGRRRPLRRRERSRRTSRSWSGSFGSLALAQKLQILADDP